MTKWMKLGIGLGALVLAVAAGTAAFATLGDDDGGDPASERQANPEDSGGDALGQCAPGVTDCVDVVVDPAGACLEGATEPCVDNPGAAGGTCLAGSTEPCTDSPGVSHMCVEGAADCDDMIVGTADCPPDATTCGPDTIIEAVYCEPGQTIEQCFPDGVPAGYDCITLESFPIQVECFVPDNGDGDPCTQPDANVRCLPPDCAVSSDGGISCPATPAEPCDAAGGCSSPAGCPDDDPNCEVVEPEEGGGSDGQAPDGPGVPAPAPGQ